ncbi:MAG: cytochrome c [Gammaproteobacteria bacterium]
MKNSKRNLLVFAGVVAVVSMAQAHEGAKGVVKERMGSMSAMGDALKIIADMVKGKAEYNIDEIRASTEVLSTHANKITDYFPDTEESKKSYVSEALPEIWKNWPEFEAQSQNLEKAVSDLEKQAALELDQRALRIVFAKTAKACSACHDDFRKPQE